MGERLSVPLTWGGTRRAALEIDRTFKSGPLTRVESSIGDLAAREPAFRDRRSARGAERRAPSGASRDCFGSERRRRSSSVDFGGMDDRAVDGRRRCARRHPRRPELPAQRLPARHRMDRPARPQHAEPHRPLHHRRSRLRRPHRSGRRRCAGAIHERVRRTCLTTSGCCSAEHPRCAGSAPGRSTAIARWSRPRRSACRSRRC